MDGTTERGFAMYADIALPDDGYKGNRFTVQESSLATEHKVWIGMDDFRAHLGIDEARRVRDALNEFLGESTVPVAVAREYLESVQALHATHPNTSVHGRQLFAGQAITPHCAWECRVVGEHTSELERFHRAEAALSALVEPNPEDA